jgi:pilus assembly protein CpaC
VADAVKASQIMALAQAYAARAAGGGTAATPDGAPASVKVVNMLAIAAPQQVMLEVKIAEVSKSLVDQLGASLASTCRWATGPIPCCRTCSAATAA